MSGAVSQNLTLTVQQLSARLLPFLVCDENPPTGGVVVVVLTMLIGATAVPGALSEPEDNVRESYLDLRETTIEPAAVDGRQ